MNCTNFLILQMKLAMSINKYLRLPLMNWNKVQQRPEARLERGRVGEGRGAGGPTTHDLNCPHCGTVLRVAIRAINTRCTQCQKHLRLEDVVLRGDSPITRVITCGSILVEPSARFSGILQATEIIIAGRVMGTVIGTQRVQVTSTGKVAGTIASRDLQADPQAIIDGEVNILHANGHVSRMTTGTDRSPPKYRPGE